MLSSLPALALAAALAAALATASAAPTHGSVNNPVNTPAITPTTAASACTAARLRAFVAPTGIRQHWPVAPALPAPLDGQTGVLIADQGQLLDGYSQWLLVDAGAAAAYVVQRGGLAGAQTLYGPLPVAACTPALGG